MANAGRDQNSVPTLLGVSSSDGSTPIPVYADPTTHRLLVDIPGSTGTVTSVSVVTANGFAGTVATATTTPAITLTTTITGILLGNGTAITTDANFTWTAGTKTLGIGNVVIQNTGSGEINISNNTSAFTFDAGSIGMSGGTLTTTSNGVPVILSSGNGGSVSGNAGDIIFNGGLGQGGNADGANISAKPGYKAGSGAIGHFRILDPLSALYATLETSSIASTGKTYTFPNSSGVFALTTDLGLTIGTTTIASGTNTKVLYDNSGILGEYTVSGSGNVAMTTSPVFTTPNIGAATATTVNGLTITSSTGTLTITNAKVFSVAKTLTLDGTDSTTMTFPTTSATIARTDAGNTFTGASTASAWVLTSPTITTKISPTSDDGAPLGDTTHNFSDLFLASGALVNFANGNAVITHSSGIISVTTGELRVTSANVGTNADSVPTLSSTSTVTNKTLTSPTIQTTPTLAAGTNLILTVPSADDTATGEITNAFNSGYTSSAIGDLVYLDSSSTWQKADADASAATYSGILGIALEVKASANALKVLLRGFAYCSTAFPTFTIGSPVYMSATAGAVTQTAPVTTDSATRVLGWAVHADKMWFNPSGDYITHT